jgi:hypothetical protein
MKKYIAFKMYTSVCVKWDVWCFVFLRTGSEFYKPSVNSKDLKSSLFNNSSDIERDLFG